MADFNADDFTRLVTLYAPETVTALAFSPDGSLLAVAAGDKIHLFQVPPQARESRNSAPPSVAPTSA